MRIRSPGYPSINLADAIDFSRKIFGHSRQNTIDREAAVKDLGYSGLTGQSAKMLADLTHFGLIQKAGKGGVRVTDLAVRVLHPHTAEDRTMALHEAAFSPDLFGVIKEQWPDGFVSENALRSYLMRSGFSSSAVGPAAKSYFETYQFLQQEGATESYRLAHAPEPQRVAATPTEQLLQPALPSRERVAQTSDPAPQDAQRGEGVSSMTGERELTTGMLSKGASFRLVVSGRIGVREIDRLIRKLELDKEILADSEDEEERPE